MTDNAASVTSVPPITTPPVPAPPANQPTQARNDNSDAGRYRLTIEAVGGNRFVYKVLDRVTGEVIRQLPREEVEKLISDPVYRRGEVVDTKA